MKRNVLNEEVRSWHKLMELSFAPETSKEFANAILMFITRYQTYFKGWKVAYAPPVRHQEIHRTLTMPTHSDFLMVIMNPKFNVL